MRTQSNPAKRDQNATSEPEDVVRLIDEMAKKIDSLTQVTQDVRAEVSLVKARLFNGLTDTMRETYAKVLILENKQEETSLRVLDIQKSWVEKFTSHDTRERLFHSVMGMVMALMLITFSIMVVYKLQGHDATSLFFNEKAQASDGRPVLDYGWSLVGP